MQGGPGDTRRVYRVRVVCEKCKFYTEEQCSKRCVFPENLSSNWIGVVYKLHPEAKNIIGGCGDYEEINSGDNG